MNPRQLRDDALAIWQAGVEAVKPKRLIQDKVRVVGTALLIEDYKIELKHARRLIVVGAGKASASLATELQDHALVTLNAALPKLQIDGWINAPEGAVSEGSAGNIRLFEARPAGINEPTTRAVAGTKEILQLVESAQPTDVVLCLLSGGGSALLTAPATGIQLEDKQAVARLVAAAGGDIYQLNTVRRALSQVKAGGLARACRAKQLVCLVLSDVLGDSLETIASGPTVLNSRPDPAAAMEVLRKLDIDSDPALAQVVAALAKNSASPQPTVKCHVQHIVLGNNADAVDAAGAKSVELGYRYVMEAARKPEGDVLDVSQHAVAACLQLLSQDQVTCWISGGEPTVRLPEPQLVGKGGRNQQLALATMLGLADQGWPTGTRCLALASGGTDGEDGPTDAAGAWFDQQLFKEIRNAGLDMRSHLNRADAYPLFEAVGGLIKTGATGTNVCDLRVCVAGSVSAE